MSTIITRIGFCLTCHKALRPKTEQICLLYGSHGYKVHHAIRIGHFGFVPTLYKLIKVTNEEVIIEKCCSMFECGVDRKWKFKDGLGYWLYQAEKWERQIFTLNQWNGLVQWKNEGQYWI